MAENIAFNILDLGTFPSKTLDLPRKPSIDLLSKVIFLLFHVTLGYNRGLMIHPQYLFDTPRRASNCLGQFLTSPRRVEIYPSNHSTRPE